ncbi:MAG: tetratricopeptide repeat protein [Fuerstiella sp.]
MGLRLLLGFGAILPFFAAGLTIVVISVGSQNSPQDAKNAVPTGPQEVPIRLVSAQQDSSSVLQETSDGGLKQPPMLSTQSDETKEVVQHIENWQPEVSSTAEPQSVSQILSTAQKQWGSKGTIRQIQAGESEGDAEQLPEIMQFSMKQIDRLIAGGNYPFALELLQDAYANATSLLKVQMELRMALCAELLARPQESLKYYRMVMKSPLSQGLSDAASLSASRVLVDQGRQDLASAILARLLIQREQLMSTSLRGELMHSLASCLTPDSTQASLLHANGWVIPRSHRSPTQLMENWNVVSKDTTEIAEPGPALTVRRLTSSADGIYVNCYHKSVSVMAVIQSVAKAAKLRLAVDKDVVQFLSERTSPIACREFPLDVFLDSVCMPLLIEWSLKDGVLLVELSNSQSSSKKKIERFRRAQRFLRLAVTMAPEHSQASLSYLYLGVTYAELGRVDRAVRYFRTSMDQYPRSNVRAAARFNLGKANLATDNRSEALREFYQTVDQVAGPEIDAAAYMYIGRILMENDLPRDAVNPLARAVAFATGSDQEPDAAVLLSAAYLMHGQMEAANTVLDQHRECFDNLLTDQQYATQTRLHLRKQAAMLSSLARFWGTRGMQRGREGTKLLSSLSPLKLDLMFGDHNAFLVGAGYGAIGMMDVQKEVFQAAVAKRPPFPLQDRMKLVLAGESSVDEWLKDDHRSQIFSAEDRRKSVATVPALVNLKSQFSAAEQAFRRGQSEECLKLCSSIQADLDQLPIELIGSESESAIRRANLRLLGKAHQSLGNHAQAIRSLSGMIDAATSKTNRIPSGGSPLDKNEVSSESQSAAENQEIQR